MNMFRTDRRTFPTTNTAAQADNAASRNAASKTESSWLKQRQKKHSITHIIEQVYNIQSQHAT